MGTVGDASAATNNVTHLLAVERYVFYNIIIHGNNKTVIKISDEYFKKCSPISLRIYFHAKNSVLII